MCRSPEQLTLGKIETPHGTEFGPHCPITDKTAIHHKKLPCMPDDWEKCQKKLSAKIMGTEKPQINSKNDVSTATIQEAKEESRLQWLQHQESTALRTQES